MKPDVYFMQPARDGLPVNPPHELLLRIDDLLKVEGYRLGLSSESSFAFSAIQLGIIENGITHYTNSVRLLESVLPDSTPRASLVGLLYDMVRKINATSELLIIDPYIFPKKPDADYIDFLKDVFSSAIGNIDRLEVVTKADRDGTTESAFSTMISGLKPTVTIRTKYTDCFHDRFWIADGSRGVFVGTSLNGIGRRYSIADYLLATDVKDIYARFGLIP